MTEELAALYHKLTTIRMESWERYCMTADPQERRTAAKAYELAGDAHEAFTAYLETIGESVAI